MAVGGNNKEKITLFCNFSFYITSNSIGEELGTIVEESKVKKRKNNNIADG